jgi:hypothetical protein
MSDDANVSCSGMDIQAARIVESTPRRLVPPSYTRATWRTVLPVDDDGRQGIAFDLADRAIVRLSIDSDTAWNLFDLLRQSRSSDPRFQSEISTGSASLEGAPDVPQQEAAA